MLSSPTSQAWALYIDPIFDASTSLRAVVARNLHSASRTVKSLFSRSGSGPFSLRPFTSRAHQALNHLHARLRISTIKHYLFVRPDYFTAFVISSITVILVMSRWGRFHGWERASPFHHRSPHVTDDDYAYVTTEDLEDSPRGYRDSHPSVTSSTPDDDLSPDILVLRHRGTTYLLQFPAYSIGDGKVHVGQVRRQAAQATKTDDANCIKLLYKGRILKDDDVAAKDEGLKQLSELMCVIHDAPPVAPQPVDDTGSEEEDTNPSGSVDTKKKRRTHRSKKKKKSKTIVEESHLAPRSEPNLPSTQDLETPGAANAAIEKLEQLSSKLHTEYVPLCEIFLANPPEDPKERDFEHKKLSETILAQIVLQLDAVETAGDDSARQRRRALVKEAQAMLAQLDDVLQSKK